MYFYFPYIQSNKITPEYSRHFFSCRVKSHDIVHVTDLKGNLSKIELVDVNKKTFNITIKTIETRHYPKDKTSKILLQALPEKLYMEKLFEIAPLADIQKIVIFSSDFSQKQSIPLQRLENILIRSCEQGQIVWKPEIQIVSNKKELENIIKDLSPVVLEVQEDKIPKHVSVKKDTDKLSVLIGPEGGWSENEISFFKQQDLEFANLGKMVYPSWLAGFVWFVNL